MEGAVTETRHTPARLSKDFAFIEECRPARIMDSTLYRKIDEAQVCASNCPRQKTKRQNFFNWQSNLHGGFWPVLLSILVI
jgi:hypothetical protein